MNIPRDEKHKKAQHTWYLKNKEKIENNNKTRRMNNRKWLNEYRSNCTCYICGISGKDCPSVIHFHHLDSSTKYDNLSNMSNSMRRIEKIWVELEKCIPLCANCHRTVHKMEYDLNKHSKHQIKTSEWYKDFKKSLRCEICGENRTECLDLHHKQDVEKINKISSMVSKGTNIDKILGELNKCECLCANCHTKKHNII